MHRGEEVLMPERNKACCCAEAHRTLRLVVVLVAALLMQGFMLVGQSGYPMA